MNFSKMLCPLLLLLIPANSHDASAQAIALDGSWQGVMEREGATITVRFDFQTRNGTIFGKFTSESQRTMEYPFGQVTYTHPNIAWSVDGALIFDGVVSGPSINGTFKEGPAGGTFSLRKVELPRQAYRRE